MPQFNLNQIMAASPIPTFIINRHHKVIFWNNALEMLSGIDSRSVIGTDEQWRAFYADKRPVMADFILDNASSRVLKTYYKYNKRSIIQGAYQFDDFFPGLGRGGKWFHVTVSPVKNRNNQITAVMTTLQDITDRKQAEQKLAESEEHYKTLFESALDAIIVHNSRGKIEMANPAASALTGYTPEELRGKNITAILPGTNPRIIVSAHPYELSLTRKDGEQLFCRITKNFIAGRKGYRLYQNIISDITEEKRAQDNMRHYLQQITIAQEDERKRIARELHDDTLQTLNSLSRGLDSYLQKKSDLSRVDINFLNEMESELNQAAINLQRFSQALRLSILDDLGLIPAFYHLVKRLNEAGIKTELLITGKERRLPTETESLLYRIVQESFNNIRKHSQASLAWLKVNFHPDKFQITIEDNGRGFQLGQGLEDMPRAGKLGLVGIKERVRLMGGSLSIDSQPQQGTSILVEIQM